MRSLLLIAVLLLVLPGAQPRLAAQVRPVYSQGAAGVLQEILELRSTASVLVVGAHPDDEDSAFIARMARGDHARVAYLSLNRGEGGQNVIGPELFDALGVIRTEELLQARRLDGGEQFFTRAFDFGFSKTREESARMWGEQEVLGDIVRVIRTWRPLVVYSVFAGTAADGHGHHQLAGLLTPQAFTAAADPARFPEQIAAGLRPWKALKLYRGSAFGPYGPAPDASATTVVETGLFDPLLGRSYAEIAAEGRSQHKTQKMGTPELRGRRESGLVLLESAVNVPSRETSVFEGLDTSLPGLAKNAGLPVGSLARELAAADRALGKAAGSFDALHPQLAVPGLAEALADIRAAQAAVQDLPGASKASRAEAAFLLKRKEKEAERALQHASGMVIDALSDTETAAPGESLVSTVRIFLAQPSLVKIAAVALGAPPGWTTVRIPPATPDTGNPIARYFAESADRTDSFSLTVAEDAQPTQPYWLVSPRKDMLYSWPEDAPKGAPFAPPLVHVEVQALIGGAAVTLTQPLEFRQVDPVRGELRRNMEIVPAISLAFEEPLDIVPSSRLGMARRAVLGVQNNARRSISGTASLEAPAGWTVVPADIAFSLAAGERTTLEFSYTPAGTAASGGYELKARATAEGRTYNLSLRTIAYPHIQTHRLYQPAAAQVRVLDLAVAPVRVGYVMGSGDQVPDALRRMGLAVTLLDDATLRAGDLARFDTIVVGIRAAEARPGFPAFNTRLLDYVRAGGTLIVQYQQPDSYAARQLSPFPAEGATRVTDETAAVTILAPGNALFSAPNRIVAADFNGWVQERDLYAFASFDARFTPLLESHDPGEMPQRGGELYARIGRGNYVYTSYAWFRQLPAGVPGAYRLFANLVSLGAK